METFLIKALQLITALSLLIIIHEFGHFIMARVMGVKVNRFYMFFNPWFSLLKWRPDLGKLYVIAWTTEKRTPDPAHPDDRDKDTVEEVTHQLLTITTGRPHPADDGHGHATWRSTLYGLGWLPFGGYCALDGMVDETTKEADLSAEPKPWEFRTKAAWKRFVIMAAGVVFNFLLAIIIYAGIAMHWGDKSVRFDQAYEGFDFSPAMVDAGFRTGDVLLSVNGQRPDPKDASLLWDMMQPGVRVAVLRDHADTVSITISESLLTAMAGAQEAPMTLRMPVVVQQPQPGGAAEEAGILAGDRVVKVGQDTTPSYTEFFPALMAHKGTTAPVTVLRGQSLVTIPVEVSEGGKMGIILTPVQDIYPVEIVEYSFFPAIGRGAQMGVDQLTTYVSSLKLLFTKEGAKQVGGFGTIGSMFPERWNWYAFWQITAFLSVILAFMNIIPIPGLDGGYIMFLFWEMISGRKVPDRYLEWANTIGFFFLVALMLYANLNDVVRMLF